MVGRQAVVGRGSDPKKGEAEKKKAVTVAVCTGGGGGGLA